MLSPHVGIVAAAATAAVVSTSPRLIITTDIGGDADDDQSIRRLLLYSHMFRIVGLVASASGVAGEGDPTPRDDLLHAVVTAYGLVRTNLGLHASGWPDANYLDGIVKIGSEPRGASNLVNSGTPPTEAAAWIIAKVDESTEPLHIAIWGGAHDTAQALLSAGLSKGNPSAAFTTFKSKLRIYAIVDQDAISGSNGTVNWIRQNHQDVFLIENGPGADLSYNPGGSIPSITSHQRQFRGMHQNDSESGIALVASGLFSLVQSTWRTTNVVNSHGALGAGYPGATIFPVTTNNQDNSVKEGDTPSWFYFLPNGLQDPEHPDWGGWGGRFQKATALTNYWFDALDIDGEVNAGNTNVQRKVPISRFRQTQVNDFAARMDWCVQPLTGANHAPNAVINGDTTKNIIAISATGGATVNLTAAGSDNLPDTGQTLSYQWLHYRNIGYATAITITGATSQACSFTAPNANTTVHIWLMVTDNGTPPLTSYRRAVVTVTPAMDADTTALIARMSVTPNATRQGLINNAIVAIKAAGAWTPLDALYVAGADAQATLLNWRQNAHNSVVVGAPVFTVDRGYVGDVTGGSELNTAISPGVTGGIAFSQNSATVGVWGITNGTDVGNNHDAGNTLARVTLLGTSGDFVHTRCNSSSTANVVPSPITSARHVTVARSTSGSYERYVNGVALGAQTNASVMPATDTMRWARNSGRRIFAAYVGGSLNAAQVAAIDDALRAYGTAIGALP